MRRAFLVTVMTVVFMVMFSAAALAHQCTNASKSDPTAGAQIVFGPDDQPIWISNGLQSRIDRGIVDGETGEGFHGIVAFDVDGDGVADASTWINVGPDGQIPLQAQFSGPACRGLTNLFVYFAECLGV